MELSSNTASAKALRSIQMNDLPALDAGRRVLGVIRPTVECIGCMTKTRHVGVLATAGTVLSNSYPLEVHKLFPDIAVVEQACPMWVPLVENGEANSPGADYFVQKYVSALLSKDANIDTIILGCTHYPFVKDVIQDIVGEKVDIIDGSSGTVRELKRRLEENNMESESKKKGNLDIFNSLEDKKILELSKKLIEIK